VKSFKVVIAICVLAIGIAQAIAGARCYRVFDLDLSAVTAGTTQVEITAWNGSGDVAFFMNVTGHGDSGTAGQVKCYSEIQDSLWDLRLTYESSAGVYVELADGLKRCTAGMYTGIYNPIAGNKAYGNKLWFWYIQNHDTSGHLTLDACVQKDD